MKSGLLIVIFFINEKKLAKYTSKRRSNELLLLDVYFASFFSLIIIPHDFIILSCNYFQTKILHENEMVRYLQTTNAKTFTKAILESTCKILQEAMEI